MDCPLRPSHIAWGIAAALAVAVVVPEAPAAPAAATYRHPTLGFSITYPAGWTVKTPNPASGTLVVFTGPLAAGSKDVALTIAVAMTPVHLDTSIDDFFDDREAVIRYAPGSRGYQRARLGGAQVGGVPALLWYFVNQVGAAAPRYNIHLLVIDGPRGYAVMGTTAAASARLREETQLLQDRLLTFRLR